MSESHPHIKSLLMALLAILTLAAYGLFFIYSTGYIGAEYPVRENWIRQALFLCIGLILGGALSFWDYHRKSWLAALHGGYAISLAMLLVVLFAGQRIGGARRWLNLGFMTLQPAEFAKLFTILLCAHYVGHGKTWLKSAGLCLAFTAGPAFLMLLEPSYGNALSLFPPVLAIFAMRWLDRRVIAWALPLLFILICLFAASITWLRTEKGQRVFATMTAPRLLNRVGLRDYHLARIQNYLTPRGEWNERQSLMTIASGGAYGKGYLQGTMKNLGYLPRTVAPTDFIFAVICEELGFLFGALPVICLYALLLTVTLHWSECASDPAGGAICTGLSMLLFFHIAVNLAMTIRLLPVMGLPLPLLSYGGSYLLATALALGAMASIPLHPKTPEETPADTTLNLPVGPLFLLKITGRKNR